MQQVTLRDENKTEACRHHWLIDPVAGAQSHGHCRQCGKERDFLNIFEDIMEAQQAERQEVAAA
jgi:hypothetical protein